MSTLNVTPSVLTWAREGVALSREEAATILKEPPDRLARWEDGHEQPTKTGLRRMAELYKRPLVVFFMESPPPSYELPEDYRTVGGHPAGPSRELMVAVRQARAWQSVLARLEENVGRAVRPVRVPVATFDMATEEVGWRTRELLGVSIETQLGWRGVEEGLAEWRETVEELGVVVFATRLNRRVCRGFSLWLDEGPPVIVLSREAAQARIFTMMHELCHLMLRSGGICLEREDDSARGRVERFCNRVAASTLMPREMVKDLVLSMFGDVPQTWSYEMVKMLADKVKVSVPATALRLQETGLAAPGLYEAVGERAEPEFDPAKGGGGGGTNSWPGVRIAERGTTYSSAVFDAWTRGVISLGDAARVMNVRPKYVALIGDSVNRRRRRIG